MASWKKDILSFFGKTICIVLFFFLLSALTNTPISQTNDGASIHLTYELQLNPAKAIISEAGQFPEYQKCWITYLDITNFKAYTTISQRKIENKKITLQLSLLHKNYLSIKHIPICLGFEHLFPTSPDQVPILS